MTNESNPQPMGNPPDSKPLIEQSASVNDGYITTIESLRLWLKYRYMFRQTYPRIEVRKGCFGIYQDLCKEIDEILGKDKRGFVWTTITDADGIPVWHWKLCKSLDLKLRASVSDQNLRVVLQHPEGDPEGHLRRAITLRVDAARAAARFMTNLMDTTGGAQ